MADSKITALTALTAADPANDMIPIVDVSDTPPASGNTKRISINNILAASGTATLASATISGALTVDTTTLVVNPAGYPDRVGIGTATPSNSLDVIGTGAQTVRVGSSNGDLAILSMFSNGNATWSLASDSVYRVRKDSTEHHRIDATGVATWSNVGGVAGTAMTLNATGLGVGAVPSGNNQLTIRSSGAGTEMTVSLGRASAEGIIGIAAGTNGFVNGSVAGDMVVRSIGKLMLFNNGANAGITIDTSANVGIGVSPAAGIKLDVNGNLAIRDTFNLTMGFANQQRILAGGTSDNTFLTFSQWTGAAYTERARLDASGNLLCGSTALNATWNTRLTLSSDSGTTRWAVGPYSTATNFLISAASGGGVYLNGTAATSWTSASDERLKDIIEPISNAIAKVGSLRAVIGKFKSDDTNTRKSFLMAQDVQSVLPEAVDASNPDRLGVAYTDVIPLLVAAIKELTARVQTLEAK